MAIFCITNIFANNVGPSEENKKILEKLYGAIPSYFKKMPTQLADLFVESMHAAETFKSSIPQKYIILLLYTSSLASYDSYKLILYEKLSKIFGVTDEELNTAIELVSILETFFQINRITLESESLREKTIEFTNQTEEFVKKIFGLENTYNPNNLYKSKDPNQGLSKNEEDEAIKMFGAVPLWVTALPTIFAENLWKKWVLTTQSSLPLKIRNLVILTILASTPNTYHYHSLNVEFFTKIQLLLGTTEFELSQIAVILGLNKETNAWIRSQHYSKEDFENEIESALIAMAKHNKINDL